MHKTAKTEKLRNIAIIAHVDLCKRLHRDVCS